MTFCDCIWLPTLLRFIFFYFSGSVLLVKLWLAACFSFPFFSSMLIRLATLGTMLVRERPLKSSILFSAISDTNSFFESVFWSTTLSTELFCLNASYCLLWSISENYSEPIPPPPDSEPLITDSSIPLSTMNCFTSSIYFKSPGKCLFVGLNWK